jgi:hypothetical protein
VITPKGGIRSGPRLPDAAAQLPVVGVSAPQRAGLARLALAYAGSGRIGS